MQESATTLKTLARGRRKSLNKMSGAELSDELARMVGKITTATDKVAGAMSADELAEMDRDFEEWQRDEQTVYEVVCSQTGNVVTRHWESNLADEAVQEMIERDGCEPGEYIVRPRGCKLDVITMTPKQFAATPLGKLIAKRK